MYHIFHVVGKRGLFVTCIQFGIFRLWSLIAATDVSLVSLRHPRLATDKILMPSKSSKQSIFSYRSRASCKEFSYGVLTELLYALTRCFCHWPVNTPYSTTVKESCVMTWKHSNSYEAMTESVVDKISIIRLVWWRWPEILLFSLNSESAMTKHSISHPEW